MSYEQYKQLLENAEREFNLIKGSMNMIWTMFENLLDTCSINANWCNAYNLEWLYAELQQRHNQTSEVFSCATFLKMLSWKIKLCKENYVQSKTDDRHLHTATQNTKNVHILFDLKRICSMATRIKKEMPQNFLNLQEEVCRIVVETNDLIQEIC